MNLAVGLVTTKGKSRFNLALNNDAEDRCYFQSTCYPQGKGNASLYGSPFIIDVGFPLNAGVQTVQKKVAEQILLLRNLSKQDDSESVIEIEDVFGCVQYLTTMINGGKHVAKLAYSRAHLKLLELQDTNSKVSVYSMLHHIINK